MRVNPTQRKAKPGNGERLNLDDIVQRLELGTGG